MMIKILLIAALAISAHAVGSAAVACSGTYTQCAQCTQAAPDSATAKEVCATCNAGFSLPQTITCTGSACTAGIANCATCLTATPTVCATCQTNYGLDSTNNLCIPCATGATGYTGASVGILGCTVNSAKLIVPTSTGCDTANGYAYDSTNSVCVNCQTGKANTGTATYGSSASGITCTTSATTITPTLSAGGAAAICVPGYSADATACAPCNLATASASYGAGDANAVTCTFNTAVGGVKPVVVATCKPGWTKDPTTSVCVNCATGKSSSASATFTGNVAGASTCTITTGTVISAISACNTGFVWDSTNSACANCATGKGNSVGGTTYTYTGFDANCASCSLSTAALSCQSCNTGTFLFYNGTCGNGTANDTSCQYFANTVHCLQCKTGYFTTASNACVTCPSNCNLCDTTGKICSVCSTGYKLSTTSVGSCVPLGANIIMPGFALLSIIFYYLF